MTERTIAGVFLGTGATMLAVHITSNPLDALGASLLISGVVLFVAGMVMGMMKGRQQ